MMREIEVIKQEYSMTPLMQHPRGIMIDWKEYAKRVMQPADPFFELKVGPDKRDLRDPETVGLEFLRERTGGIASNE